MKKTAFLFLLVLFILFSVSCQKKEETEVSFHTVPEPVASAAESDVGEGKEEEYVSPIDFEKLFKINPDVIGWLSIPGTEVDLPVLMSPDDHKKYLKTNFEGKKDKNGALFCEHMYQSGDLSEDMITVIYGHRIDKGKMFYGLEENFCDRYEELDRLILYTEKEKLEYEVFAAVPFDNRHIMYWTDFGSFSGYENFFQEVAKVNAFGANFTPGAFPQYGDHVLILSTCLRGNLEKRFLVMGRLITG